jgi:hypothetical protein
MTSLARKLPLQTAEEETRQQPLVRPRRIPLHRPHLHREALFVSPTAIVGFALIIIMILMVLMSHIKLDQVYTQQTALTTELTALQKDYEDLSSQYEQVFDMEAIKSTLTQNGSMVQLSPEQQTYMDLSRPDSTEIYEEESAEHAFSLSNAFAQIVEYFR